MPQKKETRTFTNCLTKSLLVRVSWRVKKRTLQDAPATSFGNSAKSSSNQWQRCLEKKWFCGYGRLNSSFRNIRLNIRCSFYTKQHKTSFSHFLANFLLQHRRMNSMFMLFAHHNSSLSHRLHKHTYPAIISLRSARWNRKFAMKIFSVFSLFPLSILRR